MYNQQSGGGVHGSQTQVIPSAPPMDTKPEATALYLPSYDSVVNPQPIMPIGPVPDPAFYNQKSQVSFQKMNALIYNLRIKIFGGNFSIVVSSVQWYFFYISMCNMSQLRRKIAFKILAA